jgi:hypothetical protein
MSIKADEIVFLIGAGCSCDADILTANDMIKKIEDDLIVNEEDWKELKQLYYYIKSAILYADGIFGNFSTSLNIEKFINILSELEKKEYNIVYPFISSWNVKLLEVAGKEFENLKKLKLLIKKELINWVKISNYQEKASYYKKFYEFQKKLIFPLRIFSLNYDMCFEKLKPNDYILELGFDEQSKIWNSRRFENNPNLGVGIYLYQLHGSINWQREKEGDILKLSEDSVKNPDLIFGTSDKLQSIDPYLFYVYEFRKYLLDSKLLLTIGYSFSDIYLNNLIHQAIERNRNMKIVCVVGQIPDLKKRKEEIYSDLKLKESEGRIKIIDKKAKKFLEENLTIEGISNFIPEEKGIFD